MKNVQGNGEPHELSSTNAVNVKNDASAAATKRVHEYPREGHPIQEREHQRDMLERILAWYNRHLA